MTLPRREFPASEVVRRDDGIARLARGRVVGGLVVVSAVMMGAVPLIRAGAAEPPKREPAAVAAAPEDGFPLPAGAVRRFGSRQLRHPDEISALAVSPDGTLLATASFENVVVWDLKTLAARQTFPNRPSRVHCLDTRGGAVTFLPDSRSLLVAAFPESLRIGAIVELAQVWDVATGKKTLGLSGPHAYGTCWPGAGGKELVVLSDEGLRAFARFFDAKDGKLLRTVPVPVGDKPPCVGPSGNLVIPFGRGRLSGGPADVRTGKLVAEVGAQVVEAALGRDDRRLAWVDVEGTVHVYDLAAKKPYQFSFEHPVKDRPGPMAISADGKTLYLMADYGRLFRWDLAANKKGQDFAQTPNYWTATAIALSPDESTVFVASDDHLVRRWDTKTGKYLPPADGYAKQVAQAIAADGKHMFLADYEGRIDLWDLATGERARQIEAPYQVGITCLARSANGKWLAAGRRSQDVRLIDLATGKVVRDLPLGDNSEAKWRDPVQRVKFSAAGTVVYASSGRTGLTAWDVPTGKKLWNNPDTGSLFAADPTGRWLATASRFDTPVRWTLVDAKTGKPAARVEIASGERLTDFQFAQTDMAWLPDGSLLVSVHSDGTVRLWDPVGRAEVRRFRGLKSEAGPRLGLSPDGKWVAVGGSDRTVSVFELSTRSRVLALAGHDSGILEVAFTRDGRGLVSNADLAPVLWDLCPKDLPKDGLWELLANTDAGKAYPAQWALIKDPAAAVKLFSEQVKPAELTVKRDQFDKWVANLESPQFRAREAAEKELTAAGGKVPVGWLRKALADSKADEPRARLGRMLAQREKDPDPSAWRLSRAVQVLELAGTEEAKGLLKAWAAAPESPLADDARQALGRTAKP